MSRSIQLPAVVHIVADLDDLMVEVPRRGTRSLVRRVSFMFRRALTRSRTYSIAAIGALLLGVVACSDSNDPVTGPAPVARVGVTPVTVVLEEGATRQLTAFAFDARDNVLAGRTVQWSTDAPQVATVSASGLVRAVARGYAGITATIEGKSASIAVTVPTPEPVTAYDLVYERRPSNGDADIRRLSPATGASTTLPLVATIPDTYVRDVAPSPDGTRVAFTVAWYPEGGPTLDGDSTGTSTSRTSTARDSAD